MKLEVELISRPIMTISIQALVVVSLINSSLSYVVRVFVCVYAALMDGSTFVLICGYLYPHVELGEVFNVSFFIFR